jgi:hypothetical protein
MLADRGRRSCLGRRLFLKCWATGLGAVAGGEAVSGVCVVKGGVTVVGPFQAARVAIWAR